MLIYTINPAFYDLDWMGVVSNLSYVRWMEDIRTHLLNISPWPLPRLMAAKISPAMFTTHIDYLNAYYGVEGGRIQVRISAGEKMGRTRWQLNYDFYHAEKAIPLAKATQIGCFVELPAVRPIRTPSEMAEFLAEKLASDTLFPLN